MYATVVSPLIYLINHHYYFDNLLIGLRIFFISDCSLCVYVLIPGKYFITNTVTESLLLVFLQYAISLHLQGFFPHFFFFFLPQTEQLKCFSPECVSVTFHSV